MERYNFCTTLKTKFTIMPYKSNKEYSLYYLYNGYTDKLIDKIRKNNHELEQLAMDLPPIAKEAFLIDIIVSEMESTNILEGVTTDKNEIIETTKKLLDNKNDYKFRISSMIKSYFLLVIEDDELKLPIDCKDIRKIYDEITRGEIDKSNLPDGKFFRKEDVFVQKKNSISGEIIHKGVSEEKNIERKISDMLEFLHDDNMSILIRVAIAHYYFAYIHPYYDGNGRVSRFISSMFINNSYSYFTSMSLSRGAFINKNNYYKAFDKTNSSINRGELNYFVDEFLKTLIIGQEDILDNLSDKIEKLKNAFNYIENDLVCANTVLKKKLMYILYQNYYFGNNSGIDRDTLIEYLSEEEPVFKIKRELSQLESDNLIVKVKKRPIIYVVNDEILIF